MRPGVDVISRALPPPRSAPTDTGVAFIIGATAITTVPYALVHSLTEFVAVFGDRGTIAGPQATYDAVDVYFQEGGSQCYVSSTTSTVTPTLVEEAAPPHDVLEGMRRDELDALAVEFGLDPSEYATKADVITAIEDVTPMVVDPGIAKALAALNEGLGPGQVFVADPTLAAAVDTRAALLAHAAQNNRVALLSCADGTAASVIAVGTAQQTDANARFGALFAPSAIVPGVTAGTTRTVPYTAVAAGIISRNDVSFSANQPAAGPLGQSQFALDVAFHYTDIDYQNLNAAGVSMARLMFGGVRTYGWVTCVDPTKVPQWKNFGWARLNMGITAQAGVVGEQYMFAVLDGRRKTISQFGSALTAMLAGFYNDDSLYGETAQDAFSVDVGISVNTDTTIANGELHAILTVRMSGMAEWVVIEIVKLATNQTLPATVAAAA